MARKNSQSLSDKIKAEVLDSFDEELELELDDERSAGILDDAAEHPQIEGVERRTYFKELFRLQRELVKLQDCRVQMRIHDPLKQWKLSPMDLESRRRWERYTKAKEAMLERTHIPEAPWWVVEADDKKKARLNCIHHFLTLIPYTEVAREP